jgi:DNA-binding transcriptional LysR family regulator
MLNRFGCVLKQCRYLMTFDQLRIFLAVAEQMHFTRAAEMLYITQPAVSAAVQSLEGEYGVKLFHRVGRRVEITEAGRLLFAEARKILERVEIAEHNLRELNNLQQGELRLGSSLTIGNYWLPDKLSQFQQQYPGILVNCTLANAEEICEGTASGRFDLGLISGEVKPALRSLLLQEAVGCDRLQIVVGQSHSWFERTAVAVEELCTIPWVMREDGSGAQQVFEQALRSWGIEPSQLTVMLALNSSEMVKAVVERGVGAAAIPELMVTKELRLHTLHAIQIVDPQSDSLHPLEIVQPIFKLKHPQRFQPQTMRVFEQILLQQDFKNFTLSENVADPVFL